MLILYNSIINNNNMSLFAEIMKSVYYKLKSFSAIIKNETYNEQNICDELDLIVDSQAVLLNFSKTDSSVLLLDITFSFSTPHV